MHDYDKIDENCARVARNFAIDQAETVSPYEDLAFQGPIKDHMFLGVEGIF